VTLLVTVYVRGESDDMQAIEGPPGSELAGFEVARTNLYGAACVVALGAQLLPLLATANVCADTPADLEVLARDCALILGSLELVAASTGLDPEYIAHRVGNISSAVARAQEANAAVVVW
jgi:hypothetical protein